MSSSNVAVLEEVLIAAAYQDSERYRASGAHGVYGEEGRDGEGRPPVTDTQGRSKPAALKAPQALS